MCRLLGISSDEETDFRLVLREAPRCLATLSHEHRDGWGLAVHDGQGWYLEKGTDKAGDDDRFHALATSKRGHTLVAHVRQKTVGPTSLENTHPFAQEGWIFAHNGTIKDKAELERLASPLRLRRVVGATDSERLFAVILTRLDRAGVTSESPSSMLDEILATLSGELRAIPGIGSFNFLLATQHAIFAHRFGRSLFVLKRGPDDDVRHVRESTDGTLVVTPWSERRRAVLVASEALTDEPWVEVPDGTLLRVDRGALPDVHTIPMAA